MDIIQEKIIEIISELDTEKQKQFVLELINNGYNATKAAIAAGYSKKTAEVIASENLTKPKIKKAIEEIKKLQNKPLIEATANKCLTKDNILEIWAEIAYDKNANQQSRLKATELMAKSLCMFPKETEIQIDNSNKYAPIDQEELKKLIKKVAPAIRKKFEFPKNIAEIEEKRKKWGF